MLLNLFEEKTVRFEIKDKNGEVHTFENVVTAKTYDLIQRHTQNQLLKGIKDLNGETKIDGKMALNIINPKVSDIEKIVKNFLGDDFDKFVNVCGDMYELAVKQVKNLIEKESRELFDKMGDDDTGKK